MDNLILSFNIVLPLFLCMAVGYLLRQIHMLEPGILSKLNALCFKVFLPIYLFNNLYSTDLGTAFNLKLILFAVFGNILFFLLLFFLIPKFEPENKNRGVMIQGIFRSNFALFGLPLAISLVGDKSGPTSLLVGVLVPVYNVLAVVTLETFRGGKPNIRKIIRGILTNPLIIASAIGILVNISGLVLPAPVKKASTDLGSVATPLSLVALGGSFVFSRVSSYRMQLVISVAGRLVISPIIFVTLGILFGFRNETLVPILIFAGAPTAVSSFPMAEQMGGNGELAGQIVVIASALAVFSMFLWIFLLKSMGMI